MAGDLQDRAARARARLDESFPEAWIPEREGDDVVGIFRRLEHGVVTKFGPTSVAVFEEPTSGHEFAVWLFHKALRNELARQRPQVGELVAIRYLGKKFPERGGNPYDSYRVRVERQRVAADDWATLADGQPPAGFEPAGEPIAAANAPEVCPDCGAYLATSPHAVWCPRDTGA